MPKIQTDLNILIIRHHKETKRRSNTARIASICIPSIRIIQYPFLQKPPSFDSTNDLLIYPVSNETTIRNSIDKKTYFEKVKDSQKPKRLIFLDGTWSQTRKMYRKTPNLHQVSWISLPASQKPPPKIRQSSFSNGMSTMECVGRAIGFFDQPEKESILYRGLEIWIDAVRRNSGIALPLESGESFSEVRIREARQILSTEQN
jgi:DTW domain-containing protein YfiP